MYKEWFVDLRFPGYESTPIIDGVPEGWEKTDLGKIGCRLESGSRPKGGIDSTIKNGIPSVGAENVIGLGKYNFSAEKLISKEYYSKMKKGKLKDKDILIYKDGAYIGRTSLFQNGFPHKEASVNEHVFLLHMLNDDLQYYVFFTLYRHEYFLKMQKLNRNAAQPGINSKALLSLELVLPTYKLIEKFNFITTPIMMSIFTKAKQNKELLEARDRLLPKLMSGEWRCKVEGLNWILEEVGKQIIGAIVGLIFGSIGGSWIGYKIGIKNCVKQEQNAGNDSVQNQIGSITISKNGDLKNGNE